MSFEGNNPYKLSLPFFFFQAEDGIRDRSPSRGLGDVYKRQTPEYALLRHQYGRAQVTDMHLFRHVWRRVVNHNGLFFCCLLYTSDAADEEDSVDLGGRRVIKKNKKEKKKKKKTDETPEMNK